MVRKNKMEFLKLNTYPKELETARRRFIDHKLQKIMPYEVVFWNKQIP